MKPLRQVNVHQAKTELSRLLLDVERGHEVVIARNGAPVAKLVPLPAAGTKRLCVDTWKGRIQMGEDFDAPLTDAELEEWGMTFLLDTHCWLWLKADSRRFPRRCGAAY